jgi:catechol 2,3-dioxygenase-like lactoylglutathione lyase family enzyme
MYIDHVGINTNDMEVTLQFILGMRLVRTTRTSDGRRHYNVEIGGGNAFAVFDGAELPTAGERQHVNHLALPVDTLEEFDARLPTAQGPWGRRDRNYRTGVWQDLLLPRSERYPVAD